MFVRSLSAVLASMAVSSAFGDSTYSTGFESFSLGSFVAGSPSTQGGWGWVGNLNMQPTVVASPTSAGSQALAIRTWPTDADQTTYFGVVGGAPSVAVAPVGEFGMTSYSGAAVVGNRMICSFMLQTPAAGTAPNSANASTDNGWRLEIQPARREGDVASRFGRLNVGDGAAASASVPNGGYSIQFNGTSAGQAVTPRTAADKIYLQLDWPFVVGPQIDQTDAAWKVAFISGLEYATWYRVEYEVQYVNGTGTATYDGSPMPCANDVVTVRVYDLAGTLVGTMTGSTWEAGFRAGSWGSPAFAMDCMGVKAAKPAGAGQDLGVIDAFAMTAKAGFASLSLTALDPIIRPSEQLTVDVVLSGQADLAVGAQVFLDFDASKLQVASLSAPATGPFTREIYREIDNTNGRIIYAGGITDEGVGSADSLVVARVVFNVVSGTESCAAANLVSYTQGLSLGSRVTASGGIEIPASTSALGDIVIDGTAPAFSGVPSSASVAADAGTTAGAYFAAPTVTATDVCAGSTTVSLLVTYPGGATATAWPSNGYFPIGTTSLVYSTVDAAGNSASESRTIEVLNHQLVDASITLAGVVTGDSIRPIRIKSGTLTQVVNVAMTGANGTASSVQVPVAAAYACMSAKDVTHSATDTGAPSVSGTRYAVSFQLTQGDSNDDDLIDILDFGVYLGDRGPALPADISNFNSDGFVNNGDFAFISVNFLRRGEACGAFTGGTPRERISLKELRRIGMGHLASADLNRDGWLDTRDIAYHLQHGGGNRREPFSTESHGSSSW